MFRARRRHSNPELPSIAAFRGGFAGMGMILLTRALAFITIPAVYLMLGWINLELASEIAVLGALAVLAVSAWTTRHGDETKVGTACVLAIAIPFLLLLGFHAFVGEFLGVGPDEDFVVGAMFSTDRAEAVEFLQHHMLALLKHAGLVAVFAALFALIMRRRVGVAQARTADVRRAAWKPAVAFPILFLLFHLNSSIRNHNPALFFPIRYREWARDVEATRALQSKMATAAADPQLDSLHCADSSPRTLVFVIGESVTRLNLPSFGYQRETTPELNAMGDELTWFSDVVSCDSSTIPALRNILTPADLSHPDLWLKKPDVLLMARKAGYKSFWISNHSTDANGLVAVFASHADKTVMANRGSSRGAGSYDEAVLPALEEALRDPGPRKLIIVHLLNAHPAYFYRYPKSFARFNNADDAVTTQLKAEGRAFWAISQRNYYDNAILYMDHVLKRSLALCRASSQPVAWLFVSDHGQDVAHHNNFAGINVRAREQFEIPMIFWRSSTFRTQPETDSKLRNRPYQTDRLDHTLLGLMGIAGDYYDPRHDIFSAAFQPAPRTVHGEPYP